MIKLNFSFHSIQHNDLEIQREINEFYEIDLNPEGPYKSDKSSNKVIKLLMIDIDVSMSINVKWNINSFT